MPSKTTASDRTEARADRTVSVVRYLPKVLQYLRPYRTLAALSASVLVVASLLALLAPWPLKIVIDYVLAGVPLPPPLARVLGPLAHRPSLLLTAAVVAGFALAILSNALAVLDSFLNASIEQKMVLDVRADLFHHAQRLPLAFHEKRRSGGMIFVVNSQADAPARLVMAVPPLAQSVLTLVGMFWIIFSRDAWLAVLALTAVPLLYWSITYYVSNVQVRLERVRRMQAEAISIIHEGLSMIRIVAAFGREGDEHRRFQDQGRRAAHERVQVSVRQALLTLAVNTATALGLALVLGFGAYRVTRGHITAGDLVLVLGYVAQVYAPLTAISTTVAGIQDALISVRSAFDLLDTEPAIRDAPGAADLPGRARGRVEFEGVHFSHGGRRRETLSGVSFRAEPGQVVAVVGPTGAGKSTLVGLIPRFHDPGRGRVLLDGRDARGLTLRSLRAQVAVVPQEPLLFSGTVADNVRYGRPGASDAEVVAAARAADAHDFIERLPDKYDTVVGERGARLSGGERQRVAVARAFLRDAPVLILDEPTSAVDSRTEAAILDALDRLMAGRTTFMIAHRLSTVRRADLILVLDRGRLVERGTHAELLAAGGLYRQLHDIQHAGGGGRPRGRRGAAAGEPVESPATAVP